MHTHAPQWVILELFFCYFCPGDRTVIVFHIAIPWVKVLEQDGDGKGLLILLIYRGMSW
jgi:hypothetical protein